MTAQGSLTPNELRDLRDRVLLYVYDNGGPRFSVKLETIAQALGVSTWTLRQATALLHSQGLMGRGPLDSFTLDERGQTVAEHLGVRTLMREPERTSGGHVINVHGGIAQFAGPHSTQTARLAVDQSRVAYTLDLIERSIPNLNLAAKEKDDAKGIIATLRTEIPAAAKRVLADSLTALIRKGGSDIADTLGSAIGD